MKRHFLPITLIAVLGSVIEAQALADRDCTPAERTQTDARLAEIANSSTLRNQLIQLHPRLGTPDATVPTAHERILAQDGYVMDHDDELRTAPRVEYLLTAQNIDWTLPLVFAGAAVSYGGGFMVGSGLFIAVGAVFELAFWRQLFKRKRRR